MEAAEHQTPYIVELPDESDVVPAETSEQEDPTMQGEEENFKVRGSHGARMVHHYKSRAMASRGYKPVIRGIVNGVPISRYQFFLAQMPDHEGDKTSLY